MRTNLSWIALACAVIILSGDVAASQPSLFRIPGGPSSGGPSLFRGQPAAPASRPSLFPTPTGAPSLLTPSPNLGPNPLFHPATPGVGLGLPNGTVIHGNYQSFPGGGGAGGAGVVLPNGVGIQGNGFGYPGGPGYPGGGGAGLILRIPFRSP